MDTMAIGQCVLVTDRGALPEIIAPEYGVAVAPDVASFAQGLHETSSLARQPVARPAAARAAAKLSHPDSVGSAYREFFEAVCESATLLQPRLTEC